MTTPPRPALPPELDPRGPRGPHRTPPRPAGPPRRRYGRALSWVAVATSVAVLAASLAGYLLFNHYSDNIKRINIWGSGNDNSVADTAGVNYLLVGSDSRERTGGQYQAAPGSSEYTSGQRSDTMMLVHIPAGKTAKATVVSFPRDTLVQIPAYTDKAGHHDAQFAKLNAAFAYGGPKLLVETMQGLTGLRIDHYIEVDFVGFKDMVDALGGVTVCVKTRRADRYSGNYLSPGVHKLSGEKALAFVRDRHSYASGDFGRIQSQQYFISVVLNKVLSAGTLGNPFKLNAFLNSVTKSMTMDDGLKFKQMQQLALRMRNLDPAHVSFVTLPNLGDSNRQPYGSVVLVDEAKAKTLFEQLRTDDRPDKPKATPKVKLVVPPSQVQVSVQNGSGVTGRARDAADGLRGVGFVVLGAQNADRSDYAHSVVLYPAGKKESAQTLAAAVPGAQIEESPSLGGSALVLVVGQDYTGVRAVSIGSQPTTPASRAPQPTAPSAAPTTAANMSCAP